MKRKLPIGLSADRRPERDSLIADATRIDRRVLPEDYFLQLDVEVGQRLSIVARHRLHRHPRHLGDDLLDLFRADLADALFRRLQLLRGARFVHDVNGFVRQMQVFQVLRRQGDGSFRGPASVYFTPWCDS